MSSIMTDESSDRDLGGAPTGNVNAQKHGEFSERKRLKVGKLGKRARWLEQDVYELRRQLEGAVFGSWSPSTDLEELAAHSLVNEVCEAETVRRLAKHQYASYGETLSHSEKQQYLDRLSKFAQARTKAIQKLRDLTGGTATISETILFDPNWRPSDDAEGTSRIQSHPETDTDDDAHASMGTTGAGSPMPPDDEPPQDDEGAE